MQVVSRCWLTIKFMIRNFGGSDVCNTHHPVTFPVGVSGVASGGFSGVGNTVVQEGMTVHEQHGLLVVDPTVPDRWE